MTTTIAFTLDAKGTQTPLSLTITQGVIAGWTGRDPVARDHHIAELAAIGIAPPASTPIYYRCSANRFTTAGSIECTGEESSGEVEFCLFASGGKTYVGVGSDHTDRKVETYNITVSKQMCDKPVAATVWDLGELGDVMVARDRVAAGPAGNHALGDGEAQRGLLAAGVQREREGGGHDTSFACEMRRPSW